MIWSESIQTSQLRVSTSTWVLDFQSAWVWLPYGSPNAMCTPGNFSSCSRMPIILDRPRLVPNASSPTRSLFSSVWQYSQNSFSRSLRAHSTDTSRAFLIASFIGVDCKPPYLPQKWSPALASHTNVPSTAPGVVNTSPAGKFDQYRGLINPLVFTQSSPRSKCAA